MRQLTDAEKQQLAGKIKDEQERQQGLRETNPDLPESFEKAAAKTGLLRKTVPSALRKYGMLGFILCLLVLSVLHLIKYRDFAYDEYGTLVVVLMLLFNHVAHHFTKTGWKSRMMKTVAWTWMVLGFVYIIGLVII